MMESIMEEVEKMKRYRLEDVYNFIYEDMDGMTSSEQMGYLEDVVQYGGTSGCISSLIGTHECVAFALVYLDEIEAHLEEMGEDLKSFTQEGDSVLTTLNNLAWMIYEAEAASILESMKYEKEVAEHEEGNALEEAQCQIEAATGLDIWDLAYKYSEGVTIQGFASLVDFFEAQGDDSEGWMQEIAAKYSLMLEVEKAEHIRAFGIDSVHFIIKDDNDQVVTYSKEVLNTRYELALRGWGTGSGFDEMEKEDKANFNLILEYIIEALEKELNEAAQMLDDFYNENPILIG